MLKQLLKNIILAVVGLLAIVLIASVALKFGTKHGDVITVPDFTNMEVADARFQAGNMDLRIDVIDSVYVRRMGRGLIYRQNPKPGSQVKSNRRILLTINSSVAKKVQAPNLVGLSMRQANAELLSRGLKIGRLIYKEDIATNNVLRQIYRNAELTPGIMIESGTEIDLVVGLNPEDNITYVPDVTGLKYMRAVDVIHDNSLNTAKCVFDATVKTYADSLDAVVVKQRPESSEAPVLIGSDVTLHFTKQTNE